MHASCARQDWVGGTGVGSILREGKAVGFPVGTVGSRVGLGMEATVG